MNIVAVDPGPHVGLAYGTSEHGVHNEPYELTPLEFYDVAVGWVNWADIVVCEAFNITGSRAASSNETIEHIGILRYLTTRYPARFVLQQPAASKNFDPKWAKQKSLGVYKPGPDHARSAMRHLMLFMATEFATFRSQLLRLALESPSCL